MSHTRISNFPAHPDGQNDELRHSHKPRHSRERVRKKMDDSSQITFYSCFLLADIMLLFGASGAPNNVKVKATKSNGYSTGLDRHFYRFTDDSLCTFCFTFCCSNCQGFELRQNPDLSANVNSTPKPNLNSVASSTGEAEIAKTLTG
jgi:hypothetical protein